jgi:SOS-response transcriptional repressor LexA
MRGLEIKKKLKDKGFSLRKTAELIGETPQNLNSLLNAQDIKTGVVERIAKATGLSLMFFYSEKIALMTEAEMEQHDKEVSEGKWEVATAKPNAIHTQKTNEGIPLIPFGAVAGVLSGDDVQVLEYECERFVVPTFKDAEFLISVKGSSMIPKYNSGDIIACRHIREVLFFQWNKIYVLDTSQGVLIKRVHEDDADPDNVVLVSDNEKYKPFSIPKADIRGIAIVIGVIRLE